MSLLRDLTSATAMCALCSCASTPAGVGAAPPTVIPVGASGSARGVGLEVAARNDGTVITVAADADAVFAALDAAYSRLSISLSKRVPEQRMLGNDGLKMRRVLGKLEMRRAFDCGGSAGMPNSETYWITAGIVSSVVSTQPGTSVVTTVVDASAENPSYPGSGVRCNSTGLFENTIEKEMRAVLNSRP
jgi:hypothetical protein